MLVIPQGPNSRIQKVYANCVLKATRAGAAGTLNMPNYKLLYIRVNAQDSRFFQGYIHNFWLYNYASLLLRPQPFTALAAAPHQPCSSPASPPTPSTPTAAALCRAQPCAAGQGRTLWRGNRPRANPALSGRSSSATPPPATLVRHASSARRGPARAARRIQCLFWWQIILRRF
jgi:hypothetical protein